VDCGRGDFGRIGSKRVRGEIVPHATNWFLRRECKDLPLSHIGYCHSPDNFSFV